MVRERYDDLELGSAGYEISSWRCLNCGAIIDPVIAAHHQKPPQSRIGSVLATTAEGACHSHIRDSSPLTASRKI
jgi:hypothetical protein